MTRERLSPSDAEKEEFYEGLDDTYEKVKVASGLTSAFIITSVAFPPASFGALVTAVETGRQAVKLTGKAIRFHAKYPSQIVKK